jgi:hypothetical protein
MTAFREAVIGSATDTKQEQDDEQRGGNSEQPQQDV